MPKFYQDMKPEVGFRFVLSLTLEMIASLHVIADPEHHTNCSDWYRNVEQKLPDELLERIRRFGKSFVNWSFVLDLADICIGMEGEEYEDEDDFEKITGRIQQMEELDFLYIFLGGTLMGEKACAEKLKKAPEQFVNLISQEVFFFIQKKDVFYFLKNTASVRREMLDIMGVYYNCYFKDYWQSILPVYRNKIAREKELYRASNPISYILSQHRDLFYEKGRLLIKKEVELSVQTDEVEGIRILFSMFMYPHLAANIYENQVSIYKNLMMPADFEQIEIIAQSMKSFSDPSRLAMISILSRQFATNKELAQMLDLAPASVSQHLKILKDLDIVTFYREKNSINYHINKERERQILRKLCDFLGLTE